MAKDEVKPFTGKEIMVLFPLLYNYWYVNRSLRSRQFLRNLLRPRKDKELRVKHRKRIMVLSKELDKLNTQIEEVLHPSEQANGQQTKND